MNEQDEGPLAEWLFYRRKQRHRRRNTHTTHSTKITQEENKK